MADSTTIAFVAAANAVIIDTVRAFMPAKERRAAVWAAWGFKQGKRLRSLIVRASEAMPARRR